MASMNSPVPARKVNVAALGAAISTIAVWGINEFRGDGNELPELVAAAIVTVVTFALGYFVPPADRDSLAPTSNAGATPAVPPANDPNNAVGGGG